MSRAHWNVCLVGVLHVIGMSVLWECCMIMGAVQACAQTYAYVTIHDRQYYLQQQRHHMPPVLVVVNDVNIHSSTIAGWHSHNGMDFSTAVINDVYQRYN